MKMRKTFIFIVAASLVTAALMTGFAAKHSKKASGSDGSAKTGHETASRAGQDARDAGSEDLVEFTGNSGTGASTTEGVNVDLSADLPKKAYEDDFDEKDVTAEITFNKTSIQIDGTGAKSDGSTLTISGKGTYILSGTLSDGTVVIDNKNDENIRLILDGVNITSKDDACISVKNAKNVFITLKKGTENSLVCESSKTAAIDSETDIYFNGKGSLKITAAKDGITSKDDIGIANGSISVKAEDDGIVGKDSVQIAGGNITVDSKDDCIKSSKDDDPEKGYVVIDGGNITLSSEEGKGVKSIYVFVMNDGELTVKKSSEGIQSLNIIQNGGKIDITSDDDGVNVSDKRAETIASESQNSTPPAGGNFPDKQMQGVPDFANGEMQGAPDFQDKQIQGAPDGKTKRKSISGNMPGPENMKQPDNMQKPDDMQKPGGMPGGGQMRTHGTFENLDGCFVLNGGTLSIHAGGDGVDSNGDILINGGTLYVYGPINSGDGAIDMNGVYEQTGGKVYIPENPGMMEF
ncbi:MAG: carbohydrate-binding domain-containing protein [Lachnospiraceae bacterium]|nr:carbohydrate-binding domain-containing protein [Lachnospiraceae bacterium]